MFRRRLESIGAAVIEISPEGCICFVVEPVGCMEFIKLHLHRTISCVQRARQCTYFVSCLDKIVAIRRTHAMRNTHAVGMGNNVSGSFGVFTNQALRTAVSKG